MSAQNVFHHRLGPLYAHYYVSNHSQAQSQSSTNTQVFNSENGHSFEQQFFVCLFVRVCRI